MNDAKTLKKLRTGWLSRGLTLTKIAVQSSASLASNSLKGAFTDAAGREAQFKALLEAQAKVFAYELGHLKGSLMKMGQMLALYGEHFLPPEVAQTLKSLNEQSIPVDWSEIEPLIRQRLGPEAFSALEIDPRPLAAASMGQVHRARIKASALEICLKVQYPGVDAAIDTDVKALRSMLSMFRLAPTHGPGFEEVFQEIRAMLHQELDYEKEADFTREARGLLAAWPIYRVPDVFPAFSQRALLATSFEAGVGLDSPEVRALSEERRSRLGEAFARLFLKELFAFGFMQTDPHFGNYRVAIREDGEDQLVLLDWGAVRRFDQKFVAHYSLMAHGAIEANAEKVVEAGLGLGLLKPEDKRSMRESFVELAYLAIEPWLHPRDPRVPAHLVDGQGRYIWSRSDLPTRLTKLATHYAFSFRLRPPPREIIFLDRKIAGVFIVLKILDARVRGHELLASELPPPRAGHGHGHGHGKRP